MTTNWLRHFELQLLDDNGEGITLSDFKTTFTIKWLSGTSPKIAQVKIYNLSDQTANKVINKEYKKIRLIAGYSGIAPTVDASMVGIAREVNADEVGQMGGRNYGLIFSGDIRVTLTGREEKTPDSWLIVQAIDGHEGLTNATMSKTLAKGYHVKDIYNAALESLKPFLITGGIEPVFPATEFPRGCTLHGKTTTYLDQVAKLCNAEWEVVDDRLNMMQQHQTTHEAVVLNSDTGMIGLPGSTANNGVSIKCLINPNIRLKGLVELKGGGLYCSGSVELKLETATDIEKSAKSPAACAFSDGIYEVKSMVYDGDTRGTNWYMTLTCQPLAKA